MKPTSPLALAGPDRRPGSLPLLDAQRIGLEGRVAADDHLSLRLWLRLLSCSTQIETEIRQRLRSEFGVTLARFDLLAQLHRHAGGLRMSALSRYLMVTGGNVTGLTNELEKKGWVVRSADPQDGRSKLVRLTARGRHRFEQIAVVHESWVSALFGGLRAAQKRQLHELLGQLRVQMTALQSPGTSDTASDTAEDTDKDTHNRRRRKP